MRAVRLTKALRLATALLVAVVAGCGQEMSDQPKYEAFEPTAVPWQQPPRQPVDGTIARGMPTAPPPETMPLPVDRSLLERGRERYGIYCAPCHSPVGDGQGIIVQRGFPAPPSFHTPRLRSASDRHFYQVITGGYGIMYSYAARVKPEDRWAITAYVRALQLSQHAPAQWLPAGHREGATP